MSGVRPARGSERVGRPGQRGDPDAGAAGVTAGDVRVESATLEDAFVRLTGRHLHGGGTVSRP